MSKKGKKLSPAKRIGGLILILMAIIVPFIGGAFIGNFFSSSPADSNETESPAFIYITFTYAVIGGMIFMFGVMVYLAAYLTQCFTFDFTKPFFPAFKIKIYLLKIIINLAVVLTVGFFGAAVLTPIFAILGLPMHLTIIVSIFGSLIVIQLFLIWFDILHPISMATITRRLNEMGLTQEELEKGIVAGISDPTKSSFKKMTLVEDDVGMLWLEPDRIRFQGDLLNFEFTREQYIRMDREANAGSITAYVGAVNPIIVYKCREREQEVEHRVRLHAGDCWTLTGAAKELNKLADRIKEWEGEKSEPETTC